MAKRLVLLALTVTSAVYLTILIANYGGYIDVIVEGQIAESAAFLARREPYSSMPAEERREAIEAARLAMEGAAGLNDPFLLRTLLWLGDGLTLDWEQPTRWRSYGMICAAFPYLIGAGVGEPVPEGQTAADVGARFQDR